MRPAIKVAPQKNAHNTSLMYAARSDGVEAVELKAISTHHIDRLTLRKCIQITDDASHQALHAMFIGPSDVGSDD